MIKLQNNIIQICKYRITATQDETTISRLCTDEDKNDMISRYEDMGYSVAVEEFDTTSELWLDGLECESIQQAKNWLELGYVPKDEIQQQIDDLNMAMAAIMGGAQ